MEAKIKMKQIDAALLQKMLIGGAKRLEANKEYINDSERSNKRIIKRFFKRSQR